MASKPCSRSAARKRSVSLCVNEARSTSSTRAPKLVFIALIFIASSDCGSRGRPLTLEVRLKCLDVQSKKRRTFARAVRLGETLRAEGCGERSTPTIPRVRSCRSGRRARVDRVRPFGAFHELIVLGMNNVIRVVAHDLRRHAEDNFEHVLPRISGGEKRVDIGVRREPAFANDDRRETVQRFKLRVRQRLAFAQRRDYAGVHLDHLRESSMAGPALVTD